MENTDRYIGQFLDNRYEILEKIGSGGMAIVYKARCHRLNRLVAIKILKDELAGDAEFKRRFRTESQAVAMLSHPNIVAVYDVSRSGNIEYIVMELIEGITLKQYINRKGLLNWKEALHFTTQVAKALSHAHSRGIIHRDIKPHNIMILKDGSIKVADFGIARLQSTQNTLTQEALGSVHYISPEQAKGSHVDARSDIYSLGVVMYEMLTSHLPFEGDSAVSIAIQHISAIPLMPRELNPDIPLGLESITMHAMEPDLNLRYASAEEVLTDLEEFRKNPSVNFTYYVNDEVPSGKYAADQSTRQVPSGSIVKVESALPKPVRTPTRSVELTKDEYRVSSKRSSRTSTLVGVFVVIIFLVVAFFVIWPIVSGWINPPEVNVTIPKFVGQKYEDIINRQAGGEADLQYYAFNEQREYSGTEPAGTVIAQDPQPRQMKLPASGSIAVLLTVSDGQKPKVQMPDLYNIAWREAQRELEKLSSDNGLNLDIKVDYENNNDITYGYVIRTTPDAGEELFNNETIYIIYSLGPLERLVAVPNVVGLNVTIAQSRIYDNDLVPVIEHQNHPDVPKGDVISQDPPSTNGVASYPYKSVVKIVVSDGPVEESPSPPPTEEPSTSPSESPPPTASASPSPSVSPSASPPVEPSSSPSPTAVG